MQKQKQARVAELSKKEVAAVAGGKTTEYQTGVRG
jgi:hypothetical protein